MSACTELQNKELAGQAGGYQAVNHQPFVGAKYFDEISCLCGRDHIQGFRGSTEADPFEDAHPAGVAGRIPRTSSA
jgi:isocitrate/methylisocitrate lyase